MTSKAGEPGELMRIETSPLEHLISAPLESIIDAQLDVSKKMLDYIYSLSDTSIQDARDKLQDGNPVRLKNASFQLQRTDVNKQGELETRSYDLQVPLVTMFPVPYLSIKTAEVNFNFKVIDIVKHEEKQDSTEIGKKGYIKQSTLQTQYSATDSKESKSTSDISIKIIVGLNDVPIGLSKFLTAASNSIVEKEHKTPH